MDNLQAGNSRQCYERKSQQL